MFLILFLISPLGMPSKVAVKCVSFDGDADRIVYFYTDTGMNLWDLFHYLDFLNLFYLLHFAILTYLFHNCHSNAN